jgi:hypothetical protein
MAVGGRGLGCRRAGRSVLARAGFHSAAGGADLPTPASTDDFATRIPGGAVPGTGGRRRRAPPCPVTSAARTCLDLGRLGLPDRLDTALRTRRVTQAQLDGTLAAGRGSRGQTSARRARVAVVDNPWSHPERALHDLCQTLQHPETRGHGALDLRQPGAPLRPAIQCTTTSHLRRGKAPHARDRCTRPHRPGPPRPPGRRMHRRGVPGQAALPRS